MKHNKHYAERFIVTCSGDSSVGLSSETLEIDVICSDLEWDDSFAQEFTFALNEFFAEFFENGTITESKTLKDTLREREELDRQEQAELNL